jgi:hypothetical protein
LTIMHKSNYNFLDIRRKEMGYPSY